MLVVCCFSDNSNTFVGSDYGLRYFCIVACLTINNLLPVGRVTRLKFVGAMLVRHVGLVILGNILIHAVF